MANKTITSDATIEEVIASWLNDWENITVNGGAVLTCTETPSKLIGTVTINQGELHIDWQNITNWNVINFVWEWGLINGSNDQTITVNGQWKLNITGDWFDIGTTNGTDNQVIDLSTATGVWYWTKDGADFCVDVIPMIQIETGRVVSFSWMWAIGTFPEVWDWIYKKSDRTVMGKIQAIDDVAYTVTVWALTGSFTTGDELEVRKVVDDNWPDLQVSFTANIDADDVKADGVYMEFGNARSNGNNYISGFWNGLGWLVFHHAFQGTDLTLGSNTGTGFGGYKAPSGCNIRIPNVIVNTSSLTDEGSGTPYASGLAFGCGTNSTESEWYQIECSAGGEVSMSICNWGNAYSQDAQASKYDVEYSGFTVNTGSNIAGSKTHFNHVVVCQATEVNASAAVQTFCGIQDNVSGAEITFCMSVAPRCARTPIGWYTSIGVDISDCIYTGAGQGSPQSTNSNDAYKFTTIDGGSITNCMYFGNDNAEQDLAFSITTSPNITMENLQISMTQDYSEQTQEKDCIRGNNSTDLTLKGVEFIGNWTPWNHVIYFSDQSGLKVRAVGMIDDKVSLGVDGEYGVYLSGLCDRIDVARCWFDKPWTQTEEFISVPTTCKNVLVQNCGSKYLAEMQPSGGANTRFKGIHGGAWTPWGSTGWEDAYVGSYGNQFHDGFQSDTNGTIACLMITPSSIADQTTVIAGNPLFFKDGDLNMASGDIIEFTQDYFAKWHTGFTGKYTAATGTSSWFANEWSNITLEFQYQLEWDSWSWTWLDVRTPANWTWITWDIEKWIKLKFRFTATGNQNDMSMLLIDTTTTIADQKANFYPIDQVETDFTLTNVVVWSRYWIYNEDTSEIITEWTAGSSTVSYTANNINNGTNIKIRVRKSSSPVKYKPYETSAVVSGLAVNVYVSQVEDTIAS